MLLIVIFAEFRDIVFRGGCKLIAIAVDCSAAAGIGADGKIEISIEFLELVGDDMCARHDILLRIIGVCHSV